ncbi:MAG: adaptor protein MecA [Clostridiaceae bacterium]|nr:adaptor protein MecA [Clostridiaceae bacterium]
MKIERITPNKIKITLSVEDLKEWDINFETLTHNSPEAQDLFWNLIRRAEAEAGFYADGSQLIVEAMPLKNDGFVMIITKIEEGADNQLQRYIKPREKKETRPRKKVRIVSNPLIFAFSCLDDVFLACKSIKGRFSGESSLYKHKEIYYLSPTILNDFIAEDIDVILSDFARKEGASALIKSGELAEHGEVIIENGAVENICLYF